MRVYVDPYMTTEFKGGTYSRRPMTPDERKKYDEDIKARTCATCGHVRPEREPCWAEKEDAK
jgi:hypothetical protein